MGVNWKVNAIVANAKDLGTFELLQDGLYKFSIVDKDDGTTGKGDPKVSLRLSVVEGPQSGTMLHTVVLFPESDEKGNPNRMYGALLHFLHAVGIWDGKDDADVEFDTDEFVGREFWANVASREYDKKNKDGELTGEKGTSNKITSIPIPDEGADAPAAVEEEAAPVEDAAAAEEAAAKEAADAEIAAAQEAAAKKKVAPKPVAKPLAKPVAKPAAKPVAKAAAKPLVKRRF